MLREHQRREPAHFAEQPVTVRAERCLDVVPVHPPFDVAFGGPLTEALELRAEQRVDRAGGGLLQRLGGDRGGEGIGTHGSWDVVPGISYIVAEVTTPSLAASSPQ